MKKIASLFCLLFLLGGCGENENTISTFPLIENPLDQVDVLSNALGAAVDYGDLLVSMDGDQEIFIIPSDGTLHSGWVKKSYSNGKLGYLFHCKEGKQDGLYTSWHDNGMKMVERTWSAGLRDGPFQIWTASGNLESRGYNVDNLRHGLFEEFYANGKKKSEVEYQNGKIDTFLRWKPDGTVCQLTSLEDGSGVVVNYNAEGEIDSNESYFEGLLDYGQSTQSEQMEIENAQGFNSPSEVNSTLISPPVELNEVLQSNPSSNVDDPVE